MLFANAAVGNARAKSANSITRLMLVFVDTKAVFNFRRCELAKGSRKTGFRENVTIERALVQLFYDQDLNGDISYGNGVPSKTARRVVRGSTHVPPCDYLPVRISNGEV